MKKVCARLALSSFVVLSVTACGGGGDAGSKPTAFGGPVDPAAVGAYAGTITGSPIATIKNFVTLIQEDGSFWTMYGAQGTSTYQVSGFMQGTAGTIGDGTYRSSDAKDFRTLPAAAATVSGAYVAGTSLSGTTQYASGGSTRFNGVPVPSSFYNYNTPAQLSGLRGLWSISMTAGTTIDTVDINISDMGTIGARASANGCTVTGTVVPKANGKNVFDVSLSFGASPCVLARQTVRGVALSHALSGAQRQLVFLLVNDDRTKGVWATGVR